MSIGLGRKARKKKEIEEVTEERKVEAEEFRETLQILSDFIVDKLPAVLKSITDTIYSEENARKVARCFVAFYQELIRGGLSREEAFEMAKKYYEESLALSKILSSIPKSARFEVSRRD